MSNNVKRRRKTAQKGVQAVFTPGRNWKGIAHPVVGLASILGGIASWTYTTKGFGGLGLGNAIAWNASASAILLPISIPLLIGGMGLCIYYLAMRRTLQASNNIESALLELEMLVGQKNANSAPRPDTRTIPDEKGARRLRFEFLPKTFVIALVEAAVMVVIYGGLVREYLSNVYMQNWVKTNFNFGVYLLNYYTVLILAGLLATLIFRLMPRNRQLTRAHELALSSITAGNGDD